MRWIYALGGVGFSAHPFWIFIQMRHCVVYELIMLFAKINLHNRWKLQQQREEPGMPSLFALT